MSVPTNQVLVNDPIIPVPQSIYEPATAQAAPLGTRLRIADRAYYYAQASASVGGGQVLCSTSPIASHQSGIFAVAATSAGAKIISGTSSAAITANLYSEGYFGAALGTAAGEMYRIKGNAAGSTGTAITLYDGLNTTITSGTGFWLTQNPFQNVFIGSQNLNIPIGIAPVAVTSGAYFWLQTWGPANPFHVAATPAAGVLHLGTTGGVVTTFDATTNGGIATVAYQIGKNQTLAATAGQNNPVFLSILP